MKTLKITTALILTAVLFFSCTQDDSSIYGDPNYGTLIIKTLGTVLESPREKPDLVFDFVCTNQKTNDQTMAGPYDVKDSNNVLFQLPPGDWDIQINVIRKDNNNEVGSSNHLVTIKAGRTAYLEGKVYTAIGGRAFALKVTDSNFINGGYKNAANPNWNKSPTLYIDNFQPLSGGQVVNTGGNRYIGPWGTAKVLWDDNHLYVLVLVKGANMTGKTGNMEHDTDSVEIFYRKSDTIYQYRIDTQEERTYSTLKYPNDHKKPNNLDVELNLFTTGFPSGVSYAVVAKIPIGGRESNDIGFDLQINGAPESGKTYRWSNAVWCKDIEVYNSVMNGNTLSKSLPDSLFLVE